MNPRNLYFGLCAGQEGLQMFVSGMKRMMGSTLNSTIERGLITDATMKVLAYAIRR